MVRIQYSTSKVQCSLRVHAKWVTFRALSACRTNHDATQGFWVYMRLVARKTAWKAEIVLHSACMKIAHFYGKLVVAIQDV